MATKIIFLLALCLAVLPVSSAQITMGGDLNKLSASPPPPIWPPTDSNGAAMQMKVLRLWDSGVKWGQINTAAGVYNWNVMDEVIHNLITSPSTAVIYTLGDTPKFASVCASAGDPSTCLPGPTSGGYGGGTQCASPSDYSCTPTSDVAADGTGTDALFQGFIYALFSRYPNLITYLEDTNEADSPNFWCQAGAPVQCGGGNSSTTANTPALKRLVRMMWDAKKIAACKSPSTQIIGPAGHVGTMPTWYRKMIATSISAPAGSIGGCSWFAQTVTGKDVFTIPNIHARGTSSTNADPTSVIAALNAARTEITTDGLSTTFFDTESGYVGTVQAPNTDIQAAYVGIHFILENGYAFTSPFLGQSDWYQIDSPQGPLQGTIVGLAYDTVAGWFSGGTQNACTESGTIYTCTGTNSAHQNILEAWDMSQNCNSGCTTSPHVFGSAYTTYVDLAGVSHLTTGGNGTAPLGYKPILLIQAAATLALTTKAGNNQSGTVSTLLPFGLAVEATSNGSPVSGVSVAWSDGGAGGTFGTNPSTTNSGGLASTTYTLPATPGTITITATSSGYSPATMTETATAAAHVLSISVSSGNNQTGNVGTVLPTNLQIIATNNGTPVSGVTVTFADGGAGGTFGTPSPTTDINGLASTTYQLPATAQTVTVSVSSSGYNPASFTEIAANLDVAPASGNNQTGSIGTVLPIALQALATNNSTGVGGLTVTFSDGGAGGSFGSPTGVTNSSGYVSTTYTLPTSAQTVTITASTPGYSSGTFTETSAIELLSPLAGSGQGGPTGSQLPIPLTVQALVNGVPTTGVSVTFSDGGAGGSFATVSGTTDSSGSFSTTYTLPPTPGSISMTATATGYVPGNFSGTAFTPNPPQNVKITPGVRVTSNSVVN